jgi:hypothetical protein
MSTVSPDELINNVKPWDISSWKNFLEKYIVPIRALADAIAKQFVGDASSEISKVLAERAASVIEIGKKVVGEVKTEFEVVGDPIECLRLLVEKCGNVFLGVGEAGKYTLIAWTLRKVTKEYMLEALYPTLKDEEKRKMVYKILGIKEDLPLFVPAVKSPLTENLTIIGYPDYASICRIEEFGHYVTLSILPAREPTFGGSICKFIDGVVAVLSRPGIFSGIEPSIDVVKTYLDKCPLKPAELQYGWNEFSWKTGYAVLNELCKWRADYIWSISGFAVRCVDFLYSPEKWESIRQETNLLSFFRWLMPSIVTGRTEMLLSADGKVVLLLERKW